MPELPEVEVIRRGLLPRLQGRRVEEIVAGDKPLRLPVPRALLARWIKGAEIADLDRRGKFLLMRMTNRAAMLIHLGMTGRLGMFPTGTPGQAHDHVRVRLDNGLELRLNDTRRFGSIQVVPPGDFPNLPPLAALGPEPFGEDFSAEYLLERAQGRQQPVKNLLMDSRIVAGIGNIYASEILFAARLDPATPAAALDRRQWQEVIDASRRILNRAIASGGTTISDYVNSLGQPGLFQNELTVYGRENRPCPRCATPIRKTVMAGRATYHCPACQSWKDEGGRMKDEDGINST